MKLLLRNIIIVLFVVVSCFQWYLFSSNVEDSLEDIELSRYYWVLSLHLNVHMEIWMWVSNDEIISSYATLLQNMKFYADMDILKYLKWSINPQKSLDRILNKMYNLVNTSSNFMMYLDSKKTSFVQAKDSCDAAKSVVDKNFALALKDVDWLNMEKYLSASIDSEKCSVESRINYNAYDKIKGQVKYYYDILSKKYDYFYSNKYDIIQSFK